MKNLQMLSTLASIKGSKAKAEFIKAHAGNETFRKLLLYTLNPFYTYKVSELSLWKAIVAAPEQPHTIDEFFAVCDKLRDMKAINAEVLAEIAAFVSENSQADITIMVKILGKTLRLGVTAHTVNKIIPGLIPEWEVQQAFPIDKYPPKDGVEFILTEKLNGVRATYCNGSFFSRDGRIIGGLQHIEEAMQQLPVDAFVFDGELLVKQAYREANSLSDNQAFRLAAGTVNASLGTNKTMLCFNIFDAVPTEEFVSEKEAITGYFSRRQVLDDLAKTLDSEDVLVLPTLYRGFDQSVIELLLSDMVRQDKEGLMLNLDVPYQKKRHRGILKVKRFYTMDLPVVGVEEGEGRLAGTLGALIVDFGGSTVNVGSGFTDEDRADIWQNREDIIGRICEVKYKEVSETENGKSLQFPVFVCIREDKEEGDK